MIHATALIDASAKIGSNVSIGAYTIVGARVEIGEDTSIGSHCVIQGPTKIGCENKIYSHASIGGDPQDKKFFGEDAELIIGDRNTIREFTTFSRGTADGGGSTRIGNDNWIMAYVHIAHDCVVGNHTTIANCTQLAGHVQVGDWATLGGFTGVHQFVKIGAHAMCGVSSVVLMDIPPYVTVGGNPLTAAGVNSEGLKRRGYLPEQIANLKRAYKILYRSSMTLAEARGALAIEAVDAPEIRLLTDFLSQSTRGIVR